MVRRKQTHIMCQSAQLMGSGERTQRHVGGGRLGVKGEGRGGFEIAFCQEGKCSGSSGVKEGCRVKGRGTLQQLVSIIRGAAAECTGTCVYTCVSVYVCEVEASQGEG